MIQINSLASGSKGNCYHITDGSSPLLLECGLTLREIQRGIGFRINELQACLISHEHQDHCKSVKDLMKAGIDIYTSYGTADILKLNGHRVKKLEKGQVFYLGNWTGLAFEVQHDAKEPLGFLLGNKNGDKLLYATDTFYLKYKFRGLTHIMIECNHSLDILEENVRAGKIPIEVRKRLPKTHFSLDNCKEFLKANDLTKVKEIWLIHLSEQNSDPQLFKTEIQKLTGKPVYIAGEG